MINFILLAEFSSRMFIFICEWELKYTDDNIILNASRVKKERHQGAGAERKVHVIPQLQIL